MARPSRNFAARPVRMPLPPVRWGPPVVLAVGPCCRCGLIIREGQPHAYLVVALGLSLVAIAIYWTWGLLLGVN